MIELIAKYGSIANIPDSDLQNHGLEKIKRDGGYILRRINDTDAGSTDLVQFIARYHGLKAEQIPDYVSPTYLKRMQTVIDGFTKSDKESAEVGLIDVGIALATYWGQHVEYWANGCREMKPELAEVHNAVREIFRVYNLDLQLWLDGIGAWHVDLNGKKIEDESVRFNRLLPEFRRALSQFIGQDLVNPKACLQNIAAKIGVKKADLPSIIAAVEANPKLLKKVLTIAHERAVRKGALRRGKNEGLFHLKRIKKTLSDKRKVSEGLFTISLASKNPFTILDIGNDSGCCIGIYVENESKEFGTGFGAETVPVIAIDPMVPMVEVRHGKDRVGSAMMFLAVDENHEFFVAVNSIELNSKLAPVAESLSDAIIEWIMAYAKKVGVAYAAMGSHDYNTGINAYNMPETEDSLFSGVALCGLDFPIHMDINSSNDGDSIRDYSFSRRLSVYVPSIESIYQLVRLPLANKQQRFEEQEAELNSCFEAGFTRQDLQGIGIKMRKLGYIDFTPALELLNKLIHELGLDPGKKIPGIVLPCFTNREDGPEKLTISNLSECEMYSEGDLVNIMTMIPIAPEIDPHKAKESKTVFFHELAIALLLMHHTGLNTDGYIGFHVVWDGRDDEEGKLAIHYLQFTGSECILHRKLPKNTVAQEWYVKMS
ncbi:MAG: hypothetical protein P1P90_03220 [Patescibacteria group bacterium]|nr:hypothetical protein [Patescibacteria group bacterium]